MAKRETPNFGLPIIDTHCHLDYLKDAPLDEILERARSLGVERFLTISVEPENFAAAQALADQYDDVWCTQGVHPHEADQYSDAVEQRIVAGLKHDRTLAVGEIGLDYFYDNAPREKQREVFARQLAIAVEHDKPIVVHTREADDDTITILQEFAPQLARKGVIHSFTSTLRLAEFCLEQGFCLGFNGIVTFNKAENVREVLKATPLKRVLLETDAPFLAPVPMRGRENNSSYLPFIAEKVAQVHDCDVETVIRQTTENAKQLFWGGA